MQDHLQFIQQFANTISATFRQFAQLCRTHLKKAKDNRPEFTQLQTQLIKERKLRMELEEKIKARLSGEGDKGEKQGGVDRANEKEKRKPKNPFMLFVADQRDKILKDHPSLDFYRITSLAAIKWKKLNEETRQVYERKFQEISKLYTEEESQPKEKETVMVKREYTQEEEPEREGQESHIRQRDERMEEQNEREGDSREQKNDLAGTVMIEEEYAQTQVMAEPQKDTIENILDLFHTQQQPENLEGKQEATVQQVPSEAADPQRDQEKQPAINESEANPIIEEERPNDVPSAESPHQSEQSPEHLRQPQESIEPQE